MSLYLRVLCFALALFLPALNGHAQQTTVGIIKNAEGQAFVIRAGKAMAAKPGLRLINKDAIQTGEGGSVGVVFRDDTTVALGPHSEFVVEEFMFQPSKGNLSFIGKMNAGTMSFHTGQMGKIAPKAVKVKLPAATIGTRGTHFLVKVD